MPPLSIDDLLNKMIEADASDLYVTSGAPARFRVHGGLQDITEEPLSAQECAELAESLMSEPQRAEFQRDLELNFSYSIGETGRFRVNVFTQRGDAAIVIRRIKVEIPQLEDLNLPVQLSQLILAKRGLLLMTGATGSGKSTTLAAMIGHRNETAGGHIITIEDPIEFVHENKKAIVNQREVGIDTKSFDVALKNTLRQAPDVIYIGEIRDRDTMGFALHAAETGHLVLGTLHSNNANQTLERIVSFFSHDARQQLLQNLSLNLVAILSQRLIRCKDGNGRVPALEILLTTPYIRELIANGDISGVKKAMAESTGEGLQTFDQALYSLWKAGMITEDEAIRNADSANNLRLKMKGIAGGAL